MNNSQIKRCFVCHKQGILFGNNNENDRLLTIRQIYSTNNCCNKNIYVHMKCQDYDDIQLNCEDKAIKKLTKFIKDDICPICKKRQYWNIYEKILLGSLIEISLFFIGNLYYPTKSILVRTLVGITIALSIVSGSLILIIGFLWYINRNSDIPTDDNIE